MDLGNARLYSIGMNFNYKHRLRTILSNKPHNCIIQRSVCMEECQDSNESFYNWYEKLDHTDIRILTAYVNDIIHRGTAVSK